MNSIGLQNPGVQHFIDQELPAMRRCGTTVWANLGGHTIEENVEGVQMLCAAGIDFLELNISCPNVKQGGLAFGIRAQDASEVVAAVRKVCTVPLVVKLSPQAESIPEMCKAVEAAGADAISLCNTFQACAIDLERRRPVFNNTFAGLSGPAVRPIALRMVWQAVGAVQIPVVGLGGILTGRDALEFIMAGAAAVQVGTANFLDPESLRAHHCRDRPLDGRARRKFAGGDPRLRKRLNCINYQTKARSKTERACVYADLSEKFFACSLSRKREEYKIIAIKCNSVLGWNQTDTGGK